jgi:hypothetical protein
VPGGTDRLLVRELFSEGFQEGNRCGSHRVVFGTLLGPEATGPGDGRGSLGLWLFAGFVCFWFPGCTDRTVVPLVGGVCGVCGLGLLFENYIVDASIFYKKQFPRI